MKILCAGEMLVDFIVWPVEHILFQNETSLVENIQLSSGGDANNNAINFAKLGHQVIYLGRIGCDDLGEYVLRQARQAGVNMDYATRSVSAAQTKSLILMNSARQRTFLQTPGTSAEFCFEDCNTTLLKGADLLQISGTFHLPKFDGAGATHLLALAKEQGVLTSMDVTTDRSGQWKGRLDSCYPYLDYFLPSIEQASMLAGTESPREIADFFLSQGVGNVAIKLGHQGVYFKNATTAFYAGIYQGLKVVDTTGAGDAFCAGFLTGIGEHLQPEACVTLGSVCSAFVIQKTGATAGMPTLKAARDFIRTQPPLSIQRDT